MKANCAWCDNLIDEDYDDLVLDDNDNMYCSEECKEKQEKYWDARRRRDMERD